MSHEHQKIATIISLQEARKIAMKDIEFYMSDLDSLVKAKDVSDLDSFVNKSFQIKANRSFIAKQVGLRIPSAGHREPGGAHRLGVKTIQRMRHPHRRPHHKAQGAEEECDEVLPGTPQPPIARTARGRSLDRLQQGIHA